MRHVMLFITLLILATVHFGGIACAETPLHIGVATIDITPETGETHDPLAAKAIVFQQGDVSAALVVCDVIVISPGVSESARSIASQRTDIPADHMAIAATHTHDGGIRPDLAEKIATAITTAHKALRPATLQAGVTEEHNVAFNRRFLMKDGTVRFNPGYLEGFGSFDGGHPFLNPEIIRPVGPIDPEVGILWFVNRANDKPIGSLTNHAIHVCTANTSGYSSDFPGVLQTELRKEFGEEFVSVFAAGTCGDVNHFDVSKPRPTPGHEGITRTIGEVLAEDVEKALPQLKTVRPSLAVRHAVVQAPLQEYTEMDLQWAKEATENGFSDFDGTGYSQRGFLAGVRARKILRLAKYRQRAATMPLEVQAFRLGKDVALVALPGEMFVELGLAIKKASPFETTLVVELSNSDDCCYVPTSKAYAEGSYETVNSMLAPSGGPMLVEKAGELLKELKVD